MHGTTMIFLVGMPLPVGVRATTSSRCRSVPATSCSRGSTCSGSGCSLLGGLFIYSGFVLGGAPNGGWFGYTPLTSTPITGGALPGHGPDFWAVGLVMLGIGSMTSGDQLHRDDPQHARAGHDAHAHAGVRLDDAGHRVPHACSRCPLVTAALIMVFFDRNFATNFFVAAAGGDPLLYQHLFWLFGHPEVYILILPGMGIVSEILPVFSRKPLFGRSVVIFSGIAIGFLGWGVWAHHMFATGLGPVATTAFGLSTMLIAIPTGVKIFNWLGTVWGGSLRLNTPMLFSLGFIAMFTIGGLSGVTHSIVPADTQQTDTYYVVAHFHYVLFGGLVFAIFGGFYYWWPKFFGRMLDDKIGKVNFWLMLIGFNLTFFPMHILGLQGQPRRTYRYASGMGWDLGNQLATIGAFIIAALGAGVLRQHHHDARSAARWPSADPWDGRTLEWSIPSPPPEYNFAEIPEVHAARRLLAPQVHRGRGGSSRPTPGRRRRSRRESGGRDRDIRAGLDRCRRRRAGPSEHPYAVAVLLPTRGGGGPAVLGLRARSGRSCGSSRGWSSSSSARSPGGSNRPPRRSTPSRDLDGCAMTAAISTVPGRRSVWRSVVIPSEHGGWGLTLEPALLGILVAPSLAGLASACAALLAFVARTPLKIVLVDGHRHRRFERTRAAALAAAVELLIFCVLVAGVAIVADARAFVPLAVAVPLFAVELWFDARSRGRRLVPELCGAVGISVVVAVIVLLDDQSASLAAALWTLLAAHAIASVTFARGQVLRLRSGASSTTASDVAQLLGVVIAIVAWLVDPEAAVGALCVVAVIGAQFAWSRGPVRRARVVGFWQLGFGLAIVVGTAVGVWT